MRLGVLAFFFGTLTCQSFSVLPSLSAWLMIPLLILAWQLSRLRWFFFFMIGLIWAINYAQGLLAQKLPNELEGQESLILGTIVDIPKQNDFRKQLIWKFDFAATQVIFQNQVITFQGLIRLSWRGSPPYPLRPGQRWQLTVRLKKPHGLLNPGTFDYSSQLFRQGIRALGSVRTQKEQLLLSPPSFHLNDLRYHLAEKIQMSLGDVPSTAIIIALAIGETQWISQEQWNIFKRTGTIHLMAISGLHIGFITLLSFWLAKRLWGYFGHAAVWYPAHYFALWISLLTTFCYALIAGFSVPTQRTFIMISVALFMGIGLARQMVFSQILSFALLAVLLWDPLAVMDVGFWLSFTVVTFLLYVFSNRRQFFPPSLLKKIRIGALIGLFTFPRSEFSFLFFPAVLRFLKFFQECWVTTFALFPLTIIFAIPLSISSFMANLVAIPVITFGVVPLTLLGSLFIEKFPTLGSFFLHLATHLFNLLWPVLIWLGNPDWVKEVSPPPLWASLAALGGILIFFLPRGFPAKWVGLFWFLPLFFLPVPHPSKGEVWFTLLDVGQGLAALIRTEHHTLIYDTGPKLTDTLDAGQAVLVPFLRAQGIPQVDMLLLSHQDQDHVGGTQSLLKSFPVQDILTSAPQKFPKSRACHAGQHWYWDKVDFHILHPSHKSFSNPNHRSCVLKVTTPTGSILLPGDIEKNVEATLIRHEPLQSDILIVPHHGGRSSSTEAFIDAVKPKIALFSSGYQNRFHHPHPQVMQRYQRRQILTWNTAQQGALSFRITKKGISPPQLARQEMRRFWHE